MSRVRIQKWVAGGWKCMHMGNTMYGPPLTNNFASCSDTSHPGPPYRSGSPLFIKKRTFTNGLTASGFIQYSSGYNPTSDYRGSFYVNPILVGGYPTQINLSGWGAKGWNRALPVHPTNNIGQFLVELKDVPEMLRSTRKLLSAFKGKGFRGKPPSFWASQYLNYEFGWAPFMSDLLGIFDLGAKLEKAHRYLVKNNHKPVNRRVTLSTGRTQSTSQSGSVALLPIPTTGVLVSDSGNGYVATTEEEYPIWFSGQFIFHIPEKSLNPFQWDHSLSAKLLGVMPDLNLVYQEVPWTWLLDWFTSAGDIVSNYTLMSEFNQVARYAYVMCSQTKRYTTSTQGSYRHGVWGPGTKYPSFTNLPPRRLSALCVDEYIIKQREVATPYGFGLTWENFNSHQLSILSALGLSRSHYS